MPLLSFGCAALRLSQAGTTSRHGRRFGVLRKTYGLVDLGAVSCLLACISTTAVNLLICSDRNTQGSSIRVARQVSVLHATSVHESFIRRQQGLRDQIHRLWPMSDHKVPGYITMGFDASCSLPEWEGWMVNTADSVFDATLSRIVQRDTQTRN